MRRRGAARLRLRAWPPSGALVGPPGLWARGARRPCRGPSLRSGPSCGVLGPGAPPRGRCGPLRRPASSPRRASARPAAPVAPALPRGRSGGLGLPPPRLRPSPGSGSPPAAARCGGRPPGRAGPAGVGPAPSGGSVLALGVGLGLLRAPCGRPPRRCGLSPARPRRGGAPSPSGPLRGLGPSGRPGSSRPAGLAALRAAFSPRPAGPRGATSGPPRQGSGRAALGAGLAGPSPLRLRGGQAPVRGLDKLERLCYYHGAGATRFPPPAFPAGLMSTVEGGRFFYASPSRPPPSGGGAQGQGVLRTPAHRCGGDGRA